LVRRLNWQLPGNPGAATNTIVSITPRRSLFRAFDTGGGSSAIIPGSFDNIVDSNFTISSLIFTNLGGSYHNTLLNNGETLSVTGTNLTVGALDNLGVVQACNVTVVGPNAT